MVRYRKTRKKHVVPLYKCKGERSACSNYRGYYYYIIYIVIIGQVSNIRLKLMQERAKCIAKQEALARKVEFDMYAKMHKNKLKENELKEQARYEKILEKKSLQV